MRRFTVALLPLALVSSAALAQTPPPASPPPPAPAPPPAAAPAPAPSPAPTAAAPTGLVFPAPIAVTPSDETKYTPGVVTAVDANHKNFEIKATAGQLTCKLEPWSRVIGADKQPVAPETLQVGMNVRVYYVIGHGAQVQEVDLLAPR